ncbi:hypothetical protein [Clostridium sp. Marseille-QA1073]
MSSYDENEIKSIVCSIMQSDKFVLLPIIQEEKYLIYEINIKGDKYATFKLSKENINTNANVIEKGVLESGEYWVMEGD